MYNEELKTEFIQSFTSNASLARQIVSHFNAFQPYEEAWGADLCTRSVEELTPVLDAILSPKPASRRSQLHYFRYYVLWCMKKGVPGACDAMLHVESQGLEKIRRCMVSGPLHLQRYLDTLFAPPSSESVDNLYRAYFWFAFMGVEDAASCLEIRDRDVDLPNMLVHYDGRSYPIYRESLPVFQNLLTLTSFSSDHGIYTARWPRLPGDTILRGIKSKGDIITFRRIIHRRTEEAVRTGAIEASLTYGRAATSGLFYTLYERERAGYPLDFSEIVAQSLLESGSAARLSPEKLRSRQNLIEKQYIMEYQSWKLAFHV